MGAGWGVRALRAAVFASVCVLLAALGHTLMSGAAVPWWTLVAGLLATCGVGWCLAGRERGLPLVVSVVVVAQGALHAVFELAQGVGVSEASAGMGRGPIGEDHTALHQTALHHTGPDHMGAAHTAHTVVDNMGAAPTGTPPMSMAHDMSGDASLAMFAAHTLAALLCGLWLGHGERAAFQILRAVAGWLAAPLRLILLLPAAPPDRPRLRPRRARSERAPRLLPLVHTITSRGPPAGPAVV
ncbi:hypothetical protein K6168_04240 [Streptomyces sp. FB2]|uniref:hypothetical protein n=1 Tax=Streptomyces sp. FB2 TaxID=2902454 RepID=UPI001F397578|nr:hypothetical protein [Streptomyces sp. FB2]MCF2534887.1 hypothetical protein [Streptomyces sp. FB2]